jgi:hypothetical protein
LTTESSDSFNYSGALRRKGVSGVRCYRADAATISYPRLVRM